MNFEGLFNLSIWGYLAVALVMTHITIASVTIFLHRHQAHRALALNPAVSHFFRFWLWLTTGMVTREWVAVHRKHHARCDTPDDPHSPRHKGILTVLFAGVWLYHKEAGKPKTLQVFGQGTPDDWLERNIYLRFPFGGIIFMFVANLLFFGVPGITICAIQMMSMPVFAAGIINGVGHHSGYRNFECDDAATNIVPWGLLIGGEELHNNHHAFPTSAKFSVRKWEFDIGWLYIKLFSLFGLAKVNRVAPQPIIEPTPDAELDVENLRAIIVNRMHVLHDYTKQVTLPVFRTEKAMASGNAAFKRAKKLLIRRPALLDANAMERLGNLLSEHDALKTVYEFREKLSEIWSGANVSNEKLLQQLKDWCHEAEASGIKSLEDFAERLRSYHLSTK